jgi:3-hydroxyisobutyrate dehydrogenase
MTLAVDDGPVLRAGVIGLGMIGGGVAVCLARAKRPLAVYDVRPDASTKLAGVPAVMESAAAVARVSDIVMIAVLNAEQVQAVLEGPTGVLAGAHPGLTLVLLSTVAMSDLEKLTAIAAASGVELLDCGVTGGLVAEKGDMLCMIGGTDASVSRVRPVLETFCAKLFHMGRSGTGMIAKIARNAIHYSLWEAGYEGALLAARSGVRIDQFASLVDEAARRPGANASFWMNEESLNPPAEWSAQQLALRKSLMSYLRKDVDAAIQLGDRTGADIPVIRATRYAAHKTYRVKEE